MNGNPLTLRILTPDGTAYDGPAEAVFLPGTSGPFEVLPMHAPIITSLEGGRIEWRCDGKPESVSIRDGAAIVENDIVTVCAQVREK